MPHAESNGCQSNAPAKENYKDLLKLWKNREYRTTFDLRTQRSIIYMRLFRRTVYTWNVILTTLIIIIFIDIGIVTVNQQFFVDLQIILLTYNSEIITLEKSLFFCSGIKIESDSSVNSFIHGRTFEIFILMRKRFLIQSVDDIIVYRSNLTIELRSLFFILAFTFHYYVIFVNFQYYIPIGLYICCKCICTLFL